LHSLAAVFAVMVGTALATQWHQRWFRWSTWTTLVYSLVYRIASALFGRIVFSGCSKKRHLVNRYELDFTTGCVGDVSGTLQKRSILGSPRLAILFGIGGVALFLLGRLKTSRVTMKSPLPQANE
jgi:hypothetical protein